MIPNPPHRSLRCLLCSKRACWGCLFVPRDQRRAGAPPGRLRTIRYALCRKCKRQPDRTARVEKRLLGDLDAVNRVN